MHTLGDMDIEFTWDETKRQVNRGKHGIDFADAVEVFYDDLACTLADPDHMRAALRHGRSRRLRARVGRLHPARRATIRIISARQATAAERRHYEQG